MRGGPPRPALYQDLEDENALAMQNTGRGNSKCKSLKVRTGLARGSMNGGEKGHKELHRHDKNLGFYYKTNRKSLEDFNQKSNMIWFIF